MTFCGHILVIVQLSLERFLVKINGDYHRDPELKHAENEKIISHKWNSFITSLSSKLRNLYRIGGRKTVKSGCDGQLQEISIFQIQLD